MLTSFLIDDFIFRSPRLEKTARFHKIGRVRELPGLAVVDKQKIHPLDDLLKNVRFNLDPQIHRVAGAQAFRLFDLL